MNIAALLWPQTGRCRSLRGEEPASDLHFPLRANREVGARCVRGCVFAIELGTARFHLSATRLLVSVRSRPECACASEVTLASLQRTRLCRCIRSRAQG